MIVLYRPFIYGMLALALLQLFMLFLNSLLICYHPRDTMQQILLKSGVFQPLMPKNEKKNRSHQPQDTNYDEIQRQQDYLQLQEYAPYYIAE